MDRTKPDLQQESLKNYPFGLPEGYFESFSERLHQRISKEDSSVVPVRKIGITTRWLLAAAAVLAVAMISTSVIRFVTSGNPEDGIYPDLALLEQVKGFENDFYLYELLDEEVVTMDENEAFASQAIEYLAINDVEMDLIFE